jgi:cysteine desulfurase/selenocysteine lyase
MNLFDEIKNDFPILKTKVYDKDVVYLDSGATNLKPQCVIDAIDTYYLSETANIHRGLYYFSEQSTIKYEKTRDLVAEFINASDRCEIIFTKGTTNSINLVARTWAEHNLKSTDTVLLTEMEHHSNIVPWQLLQEKIGFTIKAIPITDEGELDLIAFTKMINSTVKLVSLNHISNTLGTINPISQIIEEAHKVGAKVLIDGAQAIAHDFVDVQKLDCDFYAFSGHKIFGPTGVGVLYGKKEILQAMPPFEGGGDMIDVVSFEGTTYNDLPYKFEAGTPNVSGVIGLGAAIEYTNSIGLENIIAYEEELLEYATKELSSIAGLRIIGTAEKKIATVSFVIEGIHPQDLAAITDKASICIRTGHHCTQPLHKRMNVPATSRASMSIYNKKDDIDKLREAILKAIKLFKD